MRTLTNPFKERLFWLALIIITALCIDKCNKGNDTVLAANDLINYKDTALLYKTQRDEAVAYNKVAEVDKKTAYRMIDSLEGYLKNMRIKDPKVIIRTNTVLQIDTVRIKFTEQLPCEEFTRLHVVDSVWYKMNLIFTRESFTLASVQIPNKQETVIGTKRNGILKRDSVVVAIKNSNPYMKVQTIGALSFKPKVKFYDKFWFKLAVFGGGFVLGTVVK